ncbi:hypothetical protein, partial [Oceanivirga salmonicida]|uniref:hypothetical protein n=1 Tax=Oceanivirga salmonicida TaxID=1769291 RepID=UPI000AF651C1
VPIYVNPSALDIPAPIPSYLIPYCPKCKSPLEVNKRNEKKGMVEDEQFHIQKKLYKKFLKDHNKGKVMYLEIGVGYTTPQFIKHPFWKFVSENPDAILVTLNHKSYRVPLSIRNRNIELTQDISTLIAEAIKIKGGE